MEITSLDKIIWEVNMNIKKIPKKIINKIFLKNKKNLKVEAVLEIDNNALKIKNISSYNFLEIKHRYSGRKIEKKIEKKSATEMQDEILLSEIKDLKEKIEDIDKKINEMYK